MLNGVFFRPQILGFSIINDGRLNEHLDTAVIKLAKYQFYKQISYQFTKHLELKNRYIKRNQHSISGEFEKCEDLKGKSWRQFSIPTLHHCMHPRIYKVLKARWLTL